MHGSGGEKRKQRRHMLPVHSNSKTVAADLFASSFFLKDGRKIRVGDCALFKPPLDAPPFIGIIRRLKADKENSYCLEVNWLYRPAEIKLAKGILLDAAPNEVFYSLHKDEIPAASLLHPCKVAFLRKGVELPSGLSSFVCRRVYDTDQKRLWWLTDKDYINEQQEEVDKLLDKTRLEMHGAMQSGGRSPKPLNGPASVLQSNPCSDSVQNSSSLTSLVKNRKRERVDQGSEPTKRECLLEKEDGEFDQENTMKYEISKITDKKGLIDIEGVEKLIKLMHLDSVVTKIDLDGRISLVDALTATDRLDCLGWFLQLRGLPVLDEWLQEVHDGKICDASIHKESNKSVDEFIFSLLRALEKLPVNLPALQTCNVGKSVNQLRTHKNSEIQRRSRSLVDTWKKRVKAEMNENDAKSGLTHGASCPTKPVISETPITVSTKSGVSAEGGIKSSSTRPSTPKSSQIKCSMSKINAQSSISSGAVKSTPMRALTLNDQNFRASDDAATQDIPMTPIKDERSSSSSQSQSNSPSSDYAKTITSDSRHKVSGSASRHRKLNKSPHIGNAPADQKETILGKVHASSRNFISEKILPGSIEKLSDSSLLDHGNSRLIVRLPNTVKSPTKCAPEDLPEHPVISCSKSSPSTETPGSCGNKVMGKTKIILPSAVSIVNLDEKEGLCGSEHGSELSPDDKHGEFNRMPFDVSKSASLSTDIISHSRKSYEASLSSMNALIESCAKFAECSASPGDEIGMNLLATVAAEELAKSSNVSLSDSFGKNSPLTNNPTSLNTRELNQSCEEVVHAKFDARDSDSMPSVSVMDDETENISGRHRSLVLIKSLEGKQCPSFEDHNGHSNSSSVHLQQNLNGSNSNLHGVTDLAVPSLNSGTEGIAGDMGIPNSPDQTEKEIDTRATENCTVVYSEGTCREIKVNEKVQCASLDMGINNQANKVLSDTVLSDKAHTLASEISSNIVKEDTEAFVKVSGTGNMLDMDSKCDMVDCAKLECNPANIERQKANLNSNTSEVRGDCANEYKKENKISSSSSQVNSHESPSLVDDNQQNHNSSPYNTDYSDSKKREDSNEHAPFSGSDPSVKLNFDLNEGFFVDDADQADLVNHADAEPVKLLPICISSKSSAFHASITVASAAKGPVLPPESLSRINGELGWKGSAATSAFRPAEPRKNIEMPSSGVGCARVVGTISKHGCRPPLDFDLNMPDDRLQEEIASESATGPHHPRAGGLDLDLNKVDECSDFGSLSMGSGRVEISALQSRSPLHVSHGGVNVMRNFDLNNGPSMEGVRTELPSRYQENKNIVTLPSTVPSLAMNSVEFGNFSSWFPQANFSTVTAIPSIFPGRGDQSYVPPAGSQRLLVPTTATNPFTAEMYRGQVLSSSPAMPFPPSMPFHYPRTGFSMSSSSFSGCSTGFMDSTSVSSLCYPTMPSQLGGHTGLVSTHYPMPYIMSFPGASNNVGPDNEKWGNLGLDLNTGPGCSGVERRDERFASSLRHFPVSNSQSLVDEPVKMFQVGGLKRKEADSGLDLANRFRSKQTPHQ